MVIYLCIQELFHFNFRNWLKQNLVSKTDPSKMQYINLVINLSRPRKTLHILLVILVSLYIQM